jgi:hypothetical protein
LETVLPGAEGSGVEGGEVRLQCTPGHFYVGNLTAPHHYVEHAAPLEGEEALQTAVLGPVHVVLLCRSSCFRQSRAGTQAQGPNPRATLQAVAEAQRDALNDRTWALPTLEDCRLAELEADLA